MIGIEREREVEINTAVVVVANGIRIHIETRIGVGIGLTEKGIWNMKNVTGVGVPQYLRVDHIIEKASISETEDMSYLVLGRLLPLTWNLPLPFHIIPQSKKANVTAVALMEANQDMAYYSSPFAKEIETMSASLQCRIETHRQEEQRSVVSTEGTGNMFLL